MVIPWVGCSLAELIKRVEPTGNAQVRRVRHAGRPEADAGPALAGARLALSSRACAWTRPCTRSTLLAFGLYGEVLPNQNGAPLRLVVPWKYGFKSGKSIVQDPLRREAAADQLGSRGAQRVRLLLQRQPEGRPSALEPGHRAPHRRGRPVRQEAPDADVQRLRGAGRPLYAGMDLKTILLMAAARPAPRRRVAANRLLLHRRPSRCCSRLALLPLAGSSAGAFANALGANPAEALIRTHRRLDAAFPAA